ncbi:inhibitor of the pro-sigma K processing machinery [Peptoniphilus asaccharolyticus DSM 20463]|uniref:Inhibitor of the pro-sigma K processing machinery n=1 Tax=Peptoniphilus asaccharolyticus DSM 20463 TaxID=573058 RepID=A0A1W1V544_PEPAS|nr:pro-sigmaK processing inhibitor BofA family protein [Peptoniphilus asaccharolyticus]MBL7576360.1 pro-sigmaK processing inhibitor BofA family protein [Peptoniphilus asaccharolyticus]SMB88557.1 inhibitor of the pro-sigma K processing machinery [Peptoniphilus asaccharolyticus DSM 20463]
MMYIIGAIVALLIATMLFKSIKAVVKVIINTIIGALILYFANIFLGPFGIYIIIKPITAFLTGLLGVPFVIALIILKLFV